ncbi:MAG: efflux RND transporter periplasmic adaptor subunit [Gemmataceae bacterium]
MLTVRQRVRLLALAALASVAVAWVLAHEGHAPLPSRGASVDVEKGHVVLTAESREALDVRTAEVARDPLPDGVLAYATLVAPWPRHAFVAPRLGGRIVRLLARPGQVVEEGQLLAEVASLELEALRLELRNAENDVRLAEKTLRAAEAASAAVAEQVILDARTTLQQQRNALEVARGKWASLGLPADAAALPVRAPVGGTVVRADLSAGKVVEPGEHLFEIIDLSAVWVRIGVLEKDLSRVQEGQPVELRLTAYPGEVFRARVQVKGLAMEPQTHVNPVWAELANPPGREPRLLPGMSGQVRVVMPAEPRTWTVPAEAVVHDGVEPFVLVEEARAASHSEYRRRPIEITRQGGDRAEVRSPELVPGDRVVTRGAHELGGYFIPGVVRPNPLAAKSMGLQVAAVGERGVEEVVEVEGHVDVPPDRRSAASAPLGGYVRRLHVDRAQLVKAGDLLAEVASLEFQTLQLDLVKEHLAFGLLDQQLERLRKAGGVAPSRKLVELEAAHAASRNRRDGLREKLRVLGLSAGEIDRIQQSRQLVEAMPIRAAIGGHVVEFAKVIGHVVKADEPLVTIHDLSAPLVVGFVPERDLPHVRVGMAARVRLVGEGGRVRTGQVVRSGRAFAEADQTLPVWVRLDEPPGAPLRHNQLARLSLVVASRPSALAVPPAALVHEGTQAFVFVRKGDGAFDRRAVRTGHADDRLVEITSGLRAGETIAVAGVAGLRTAYASVR